jgi:hypothetical protein
VHSISLGVRQAAPSGPVTLQRPDMMAQDQYGRQMSLPSPGYRQLTHPNPLGGGSAAGVGASADCTQEAFFLPRRGWNVSGGAAEGGADLLAGGDHGGGMQSAR